MVRVFVNKAALVDNVRSLSESRVVAGTLSGCIAGILGIEGFLIGTLFYVLFALGFAFVLSTVVLGGQSTKYFAPNEGIYFGGLSPGILPFLFSWTLLYNIVWIFKLDL